MGLVTKMGLGFGVVLTLVVAMAVLGWTGLETIYQGIVKFDRYAKNSVLANKAQSQLLSSRLSVFGFMSSGTDEAKNAFYEEFNEMQDIIADSKNQTEHAENLKIIDQVAVDSKAYVEAFDQIGTIQDKRNNLVYNVLDKHGPAMEKSLSSILGSAYQDGDMVAANHSALALRALLLARLYTIKFLDSNDPKHQHRVAQEFEKLDGELNTLDSELQNPVRRNYLSQVTERRQVYFQAFVDLTEAIYARNKVIKESLDVVGERIVSQVGLLNSQYQDQQTDLGTHLKDQAVNAENFLAFFALISVVLGVFSAWFLTQQVTSPFRRIFAGLKSFSVSELNELQSTFESTISTLNSGSIDVADTSQKISSGATEQAASLEETSSSLEEITSMVEVNLTSANNAVELSKKVEQESIAANDSMTELKGAMSEILESNRSIEELVRAIGIIEEKTKVMDEIVFQTKLLSFNASVEAERAGEYGRGFAVVAQEIGNLARMSGEAGIEIADIVKSSMKNAETVARENSERVATGSAKVSSVAEGLLRIRDNAVTLVEGSQQVAAASDEQSRGLKEISKAVIQLDSVTQDNASSTENLSSQANILQEAVGGLVLIVRGESDQSLRSVAPTHGYGSERDAFVAPKQLVPYSNSDQYLSSDLSKWAA